jgi:hypothetical protein
MRVSQCVGCVEFPCADVKHECYVVPGIDVQPDDVSIVMISEAAPANPGDYTYAGGDSLFGQTTVQAFGDAGATVSSIRDVLDLGVYLTTAVKCGKTGYGIKAATIKECSLILERVFPSYLQAGPSFFIEKSKRRMIAEDIAAALSLLG